MISILKKSFNMYHAAQKYLMIGQCHSKISIYISRQIYENRISWLLGATHLKLAMTKVNIAKKFSSYPWFS